MTNSKPCMLRVVAAAYSLTPASGRTVEYVMRPGLQRSYRAQDWDVALVSAGASTPRVSKVFDYPCPPGGALCLAARGAWSLWGDGTPIEPTGPYDRLDISVEVDGVSDAAVEVRLGPLSGHVEFVRGPNCGRARLRCFASRGMFDVGHWTRLVLCQLAFDDAAPTPL
jgi:hypothetical protein